MTFDYGGFAAVEHLQAHGYRISRSGWICDLEALGDDMARQFTAFCTAMERGLAEDEASFASDARDVLAQRQVMILAYETARWPAVRSRRMLTTAASDDARSDAVLLVELLGGRFDGRAWQGAQKWLPGLAVAADALAGELSIVMMTSAGEIGPEAPIVRSMEMALDTYRRTRYTADEIAAQDAAAEGETTYLDFLRYGDRRA